MKRRAPSKKRLMTYLNISESEAGWIRALIKEELEPDTFKSVEDHIKQCYNAPSERWESKVELIMLAINEVLEGHGVEAVSVEGAYIDSYWHGCIFTYVNMGDTYIATICYDTEGQSFILGSWGDVYEGKQRTLKICSLCGVAGCDSKEHREELRG